MENAWILEQKTLINELIEGMEFAKQLRGNLCSAETSEALVKRILSSYDKALLVLNWSSSISSSMGMEHPHQSVGASTSGLVLPESPISISNGSPRSEDFDGGLKDNQDQQNSSKKRKTMPRWTDKVKAHFESGLEGPLEDGHGWRKYGQKDILGAKYPRSYYRCTYRNTQNCWATKQVQRSDEDPSTFDVTYRGTHACFTGSQPASPGKHDQRLNHHTSNSHKTGSGVINDECLEKKETASPFSSPSTSFGCLESNGHVFSTLTLDESNILGGFSSSYVPPAADESNYYFVSQNLVNSNFGDVHYLQRSESELPELQSATNSPILNLDFSLDPADFDTNFLFDTAGFSF